MSRRGLLFGICHLIFAIFYLVGCQAPKLPVALKAAPTASIAPAVTLTPDGTQPPPRVMGNPPGPVLTLALLPEGEFLAGVGPLGDAETGFEWRLYRGRDDTWHPLSWPPEAIPRSLYPIPSEGLLFAVPLSNALFGRGQAWGLMRSTDGGRSWHQALNGLGDPYVMDLAFSPTFPDSSPPQSLSASPTATGDAATTDNEACTLFAVTWYSGVYCSSDAGQTWEPMGLGEEEVKPSGGANPYDLAVAASPNYGAAEEAGLVMASFSRGLHRWDAASQTWGTVPFTVTATVEDFDPARAQLTAGAIAFSPNFAEDGTIYLHSGYAGIFRSTDRGETWGLISRRLPLPPPFVAGFHLAAASADEVYVLLDSEEVDSALGRPIRVLYRTRDGGKSWESLDDPPTLGWVSTFVLSSDAQGQSVLHLGGSQGGVSSHLADALPWK